MAALSLPLPRSSALRVPARPLAGVAALAYVVLAGVEGMEALRLPLLGSSADGVRAGYADEALATVTTVAGALSLAAYLVFAVALARWAGAGRAVVTAAAGSVALAATGLIATAALLAGDPDVATFEVALQARLTAAPLLAFFLVGIAATGRLPRALTVSAGALAVPLALLAPVAAVTESQALQVVVLAALGAQVAWVLATAMWLLHGGGPTLELVRRSAFLLVALAAGSVGAALLAVPAAAGNYFAWDLRPAPAAAFAGGVYLAAAYVYLAGSRAKAGATRPLIAGAVVLSASIGIASAVHLDVFDLGRLQAWAWFALFAGFSAVMSWLVWNVRGTAAPRHLAAPLRLLVAAEALALGVLAVALWIDPAAVDGPYALAPLAGRFTGSWVALLAILAAATALRPSCLAATAVALLPAGALAAALRTLSDLDHAVPHLTVLAALTALGLLARPRPARPSA